MINSMNLNELEATKRWLNAITGKTSTLGDLVGYIKKNHITNKIRLLNKLNADFTNLQQN